MRIHFTKLEGLGNDFILIDLKKHQDLDEVLLINQAEKLCDRHFGIGADGIMLLKDSELADYKMRIINSDGSEPEMCGNGIRCFTEYIRNNYQLRETTTIETLAGIMKVTYNNSLYTVDMGSPILISEAIPVKSNDPIALNQPLKVNNHQYNYNAISMGNPHCIIPVDSLAEVDFYNDGPAIEENENFPEKTNVEFIEIKSSTAIKVRVWERGSGETLACGTGACAVVVSQILLGKVQPAQDISVTLPGGTLTIKWQTTIEQVAQILANPKEAEKTTVLMSGPAKLVFEGILEV